MEGSEKHVMMQNHPSETHRITENPSKQKWNDPDKKKPELRATKEHLEQLESPEWQFYMSDNTETGQ